MPVCAECVPYFRAALGASPSELVFPNAAGAMLDRSVALPQVIRRALADTGIVESYVHVCRARTTPAGERDPSAPRCTHTEAAPDKALRRCPVHGDKLWPTAKVRPVRFHHLRHTTASLLIQRGATPADVGAVLGHSDVRVTMERYAHMSPD